MCMPLRRVKLSLACICVPVLPSCTLLPKSDDEGDDHHHIAAGNLRSTLLNWKS